MKMTYIQDKKTDKKTILNLQKFMKKKILVQKLTNPHRKKMFETIQFLKLVCRF